MVYIIDFMSTTILATKLYTPPPRPQVVLRSRLIGRLNEGLHQKLTLLSAPAGFGKTTLVSDWVSSCERPTAWLSLDAGDNDLDHFLAYLVATLRSIEPTIGEEVIELLQSPPPLPTEPILTMLLNEIADVLAPFILVLDDYHLIDSQSIDHTLTFILDHLPPQMHLVIITREEPQLPLARLRVRSQLTELRAADLRFSSDEAAEFLNQGMSLNLSAADITALETRTEGWIAGLQLAALSMQGLQDTTAFIKSFTGSHRFVLDYLVEEVLQQQPEHVQNFLLHTSILDRLCGSLCDALLLESSASGQEALEYLERANLLVIPLDNQRQWYRYHHLFADMLQARLMQEQPNQAQNLHGRACEWYEQNNLRADAIHHALAAQDFERAADLIELVWTEIRKSCFQSPTWLGWVKALPDEILHYRPVLNVGYAWELLDFGELDAAERRMQDAERWLESPETSSDKMIVVNEAEFESIHILLATARSYHAQVRGDLPNAMQHARRALDLATEFDHYSHGIASSILGLAYWTSGDLETAYQTISGAANSLRLAGNILFAISTSFVLADIRISQGRLHDAIHVYQQALQLASAQGESILQGTADIYLGLSELYHEQGHVEDCQQHLQKSQALGEHVATPHWNRRLFLMQAQLKQTHGDLDDALKLLEQAEQLDYVVPMPEIRPIHAQKARIWIAQGKLNKALTWVLDQGLSLDDDLGYLREFEHITVARGLIAQYHHEGVYSCIQEAAQLLERLLKAAEAGGRLGNQIEILNLRALAHHALDDTPSAMVALQQALTLAEPQGFFRLFVDEGIPMAELLTEASQRGILPHYVNHLLTGFATEESSSEQRTTPPSAQPLIEPLSQRELEVLQLIAAGLSNREISERLFLALNTIKGHNQKIFAKLQVQRRTEAVARASELGLL